MEISGTGKQEAVSALVARIQAKARGFVAARTRRPSGASRHSCREKEIHISKKRAVGMVQDGGNSLADGGDDRVIRGDEHEASLGDGVDALVGQAERKKKQRKLPMSKGKREYKPVIYKLTSPSGKAYIGQTVRPKQRFATHAASGRATGNGKCRALANAVAKHGWESFKKEILVECDKDELDTMEDEMIRKHGTLTPQGYNLIPGGTFNPIKDPATYKRVRDMWDRGEIQAIQRKAWEDPKLKARMKKVHKERCKADGGRATRQGIANLTNGNATSRSHSADAMAKRKATWDAKREAKLANMTEDEAAKVRAQTKRKKTSYREACAKEGGADKLRERRREWARLRKERTFLANS